MSKKDKEIKKLLNKKTLTSEEAVRLLELDGWFSDKSSGTSHQQFEHSIKKGKITVPAEKNPLNVKTKNSILKQAGLKGN